MRRWALVDETVFFLWTVRREARLVVRERLRAVWRFFLTTRVFLLTLRERDELLRERDVRDFVFFLDINHMLSLPLGLYVVDS